MKRIGKHPDSSRWTPKRIERIAEGFFICLTHAQVAACEYIDPDTLQQWLEVPEFYHAVRSLYDQRLDDLINRVKKRQKGWQADKWLLTRRRSFPQYSEPETLQEKKTDPPSPVVQSRIIVPSRAPKKRGRGPDKRKRKSPVRRQSGLYAKDITRHHRLFLDYLVKRTDPSEHFESVLAPGSPFLAEAAEHCKLPFDRACWLTIQPAWTEMLRRRAMRRAYFRGEKPIDKHRTPGRQVGAYKARIARQYRSLLLDPGKRALVCPGIKQKQLRSKHRKRKHARTQRRIEHPRLRRIIAKSYLIENNDGFSSDMLPFW